jgi:hypothetical protein
MQATSKNNPLTSKHFACSKGLPSVFELISSLYYSQGSALWTNNLKKQSIRFLPTQSTRSSATGTATHAAFCKDSPWTHNTVSPDFSHSGTRRPAGDSL